MRNAPTLTSASARGTSVVGGDCANFVGQTLMARGWKMTDSWHNRNAGAEWTGSWILVESFDTTITEDHPGANAYFWSLS